MQYGVVRLSEIRKRKRWDAGFLINWANHRQMAEQLARHYEQHELWQMIRDMPRQDSEAFNQIKQGRFDKPPTLERIELLSHEEAALYLAMLTAKTDMRQAVKDVKRTAKERVECLQRLHIQLKEMTDAAGKTDDSREGPRRDRGRRGGPADQQDA